MIHALSYVTCDEQMNLNKQHMEMKIRNLKLENELFFFYNNEQSEMKKYILN